MTKGGQLFFEFIWVLKDKKYLFFLAENLSEMLNSRHSNTLENIKKEISKFKVQKDILKR